MLKLIDIKAGDTLVADGGFTCIAEGAVLEVKDNGDGFLYVPCRRKRHYLDGQTNLEGEVVGFSRAVTAEA